MTELELNFHGKGTWWPDEAGMAKACHLEAQPTEDLISAINQRQSMYSTLHLFPAFTTDELKAELERRQND